MIAIEPALPSPKKHTFDFDPLGLSLRDFRIYHRRLRRYSERHFQKSVLYRRLKTLGAAAMPENIYDIYTDESLGGLPAAAGPG